MQTTKAALDGAITVLRTAGTKYNLAAVVCPICGLTFGEVGAASGIDLQDAVDITTKEQVVTGELNLHCQVTHVHPGRRWNT